MTEEKKVNIDYKDADALKGFISENGKILSSRYTRLNAKEQRKLTKAIKKARLLGLLPFTDKQKIEEKKLAWFHCASIGEMKSIAPIAHYLVKERGMQVLVTTLTLSSSKLFPTIFNKDFIFSKAYC